AYEVRSVLLERHKEGPRSLRKLNPRVGPVLATVIEQCLAFDPAHRPASAAKVARALRQSQSLAGRFVPWVRAHVVQLTATAVLLLGGLVAGSYALPTPEPVSLQHLKQGKEALKKHQFGQAIHHLDMALASDPELGDAWFARGRARMKMLDPNSLNAAL